MVVEWSGVRLRWVLGVTLQLTAGRTPRFFVPEVLRSMPHVVSPSSFFHIAKHDAHARLYSSKTSPDHFVRPRVRALEFWGKGD